MIGAGLRMLLVGAEIGRLGAALLGNATERCVFWACADGAEHLRRVPAEEHMLGS
jgi:hypothetical protein